MNGQILAWKRKEGLVKESVWLEEGIRLYRKLLRRNTGATELKLGLANLLTRSGTDEKLVYVNLMKAQEIFEEVLQLDPSHPDALYRLGHVHYESERFDKSVDFFEKAVTQPLSEIRLFRAFATMAKAYFYLGEDGKAHACLEKIKEMDREHNFTADIKEVEQLISQEGYFRRIVHDPDGTSSFIGFDQMDEVEDDFEASSILDLANFRPSFSGPRDFKWLERKQAEVLVYLIEQKRFVTNEEIRSYVWAEDEREVALDTIKTYVSQINKKLKYCLPEDVDKPIISKRGQGYKWNYENPKIIKIL